MKRMTQTPAADGDGLTAARVRAILESPGVSERIKDAITNAVGRLYEATASDTLPDSPELVALEFEQAAFGYFYDMRKGEATDKEHDAYAKLAALVERHEPKDERLVRRLAAILRDPKADPEAVKRIGYLMCELSNETGVDDLHPDLFETLVRVYVRVARAAAAVKVGGRSDAALRAWLKRNPRKPRPWMLKKYLGELEGIADE